MLWIFVLQIVKCLQGIGLSNIIIYPPHFKPINPLVIKYPIIVWRKSPFAIYFLRLQPLTLWLTGTISHLKPSYHYHAVQWKMKCWKKEKQFLRRNKDVSFTNDFIVRLPNWIMCAREISLPFILWFDLITSKLNGPN